MAALGWVQRRPKSGFHGEKLPSSKASVHEAPRSYFISLIRVQLGSDTRSQTISYIRYGKGPLVALDDPGFGRRAARDGSKVRMRVFGRPIVYIYYVIVTLGPIGRKLLSAIVFLPLKRVRV